MTRSLDDWLAYAERVHLEEIELGLGRVRSVASSLGLLPLSSRSVIVAGTNGKGTTVTTIESLLRAHGLRTGASLSPHLHHFGERALIDGQLPEDALLCRAFDAVEAARGDVPLTYFEYSTLVALWTFQEQAVDVSVLEVGLGGRLDAFNIVDADVAVITSIGLDHQTFLGDTVEAIGAEKAGVLRSDQRVVLGSEMPDSVWRAVADTGCTVAARDRQFRLEGDVLDARGVPWPVPSEVRLTGALPASNLALGVVAASALAPKLQADLCERVANELTMPGRMECFEAAGRTLVLDVAHNPAGARFLNRVLDERKLAPRVAIYGALRDKPAPEVQAALSDRDMRWMLVPTEGPRGQDAAALSERVGRGEPYADFVAAFHAACSATAPGDVILAFGSFSVVEAAHRWMSSCATG